MQAAIRYQHATATAHARIAAGLEKALNPADEGEDQADEADDDGEDGPSGVHVPVG